MKTISKIIVVALLLIISQGCSEDFLNLENVNNLTTTSFYRTEKDFEDLLISTYMPMAFHQMWGIKAHRIGFAVDDRSIHERFNDSQLQYDATNPDIAEIYWSLFTGVFRSNLFLQKCTDDAGIDGVRKQQMIGEAYFLRGLYYFYLATYFEVPPLLQEPPDDPLEGHPNATQDAIYDQVETDFATAMELLPDLWDEKNLGRATKGAAMAYLGKTYLFRAKFSEAATILKEVIDSDIYSLNMPQATDSLDYVWAYLSNFTPIDLPNGSNVYDSEFNSESIFEVNFSLAFDLGRDASQYLPGRRSTGSHQTWFNGYSNFTQGYGNLAIDDKSFPDAFEAPGPAGLQKDPRYYATFIAPGDTLDWRTSILDHYETNAGTRVFRISDLNSTLGTSLGMRKHLWPFHNSLVWSNAPFQDPNNWRLMRYADVLLMYAEAAFRESGNEFHPEALIAINKVRLRVGMPLLTALSKEAIVHERDIELALEHKRFWDFARWYRD
ncbi:MAG: RagB/SusD family nutrient uptake outer membrane protein, partial [Bacteroidota bacterium]